MASSLKTSLLNPTVLQGLPSQPCPYLYRPQQVSCSSALAAAPLALLQSLYFLPVPYRESYKQITPKSSLPCHFSHQAAKQHIYTPFLKVILAKAGEGSRHAGERMG